MSLVKILNLHFQKEVSMQSKFYFIIFLSLVIALGSCRTAKKMYEKGNYDEAVELAARKLQKDPDDPRLLEIIRSSYQYALQDHESRIRSLGAGNLELKWESMYYEYASLQQMYEAIYRVPSVFSIVKPADYSTYLVTYAEKAGEVRFQRGIAFMQYSTKESYKKAYREFQAALRFLPGDRDVQLRMNEAYAYAVTNVVVLPLQQQGGFVYSSYRVGANNLDDQLLRNIQLQTGNEFVQFYSPWEARSQGVRVDMELDMQLAVLDIGRPEEQRSSRRLSREVLIREKVIRPDSVVKEYGKVYANFVSTRRSLHSAAILQMRVKEPNGRWVWSDESRASHHWNTEFHSYTGDARALTETELQLVERRREMAPTESVIMDLLLEQLRQNAQWSIKNHFSRY